MKIDLHLHREDRIPYPVRV